MNLDDLIKLAGLSKSADTPVQEQPQDSHDGMRTLIALVTPEQLNQLQGEADLEEEGYQNSGDHYSGEPEEYKGPLGSPADLSLRRYLGANGEHVTVDETKVYEDHKVEDITEAFAQYKAAQNQVVTEAHACGCDDSCACGGNCGPDCNCHSGCSATNESAEVAEGAFKDMWTNMEELEPDVMRLKAEYMDKGMEPEEAQEAACEKLGCDPMDFDEYLTIKFDELEEADVEESHYPHLSRFQMLYGIEDEEQYKEMADDAQSMDMDEFIDTYSYEIDMAGDFWEDHQTDGVEENAFNQAAAAAARAGKDTFEFGGKTHKTTMKKDVAHKLDDDIDMLRKLAGL
jgi:hypothetical protein